MKVEATVSYQSDRIVENKKDELATSQVQIDTEIGQDARTLFEKSLQGNTLYFHPFYNYSCLLYYSVDSVFFLSLFIIYHYIHKSGFYFVLFDIHILLQHVYMSLIFRLFFRILVFHTSSTDPYFKKEKLSLSKLAFVLKY